MEGSGKGTENQPSEALKSAIKTLKRWRPSSSWQLAVLHGLAADFLIRAASVDPAERKASLLARR